MVLDSNTIRDLHLDQVLKVYQPYTAMGKQAQLSFFAPGQEDEWQQGMDEQEWIIQMVEAHPDILPRLRKILLETPSPHILLDKLECNENLVFTEWFVIKRFLWSVYTWLQVMKQVGMQSSLVLSDEEEEKCVRLLWELNKSASLQPTFSLESAYDERLKAKRMALEQLQKKMQSKKERVLEEIEQMYGVKANLFGEWVVGRDSQIDILLRKERRLSIARETIYDVCYQPSFETEVILTDEATYLQSEIREIEEEVLEQISCFFRPSTPYLRSWIEKVTHFDLLWAKVRAACSWQGVKPVFSLCHFSFKGAMHPGVRQALSEKGIVGTRIDFQMEPGVAVIIGPNMGGKTVALKTIGIVAVLAQLGFYVPATQCTLPLFPWIGTILHDDQHIQHGLSSYGAEITRLQEWICTPGSGLLLMDELGRSTNPVEGSALAQAVTRFLLIERKWTVLVTHYCEVMEAEGIQGYRVAGIPFSQITDLHQQEVASYIQQNMDYQLIPVAPGEVVPQQALVIARLLGLDDTIIQEAQRLVEVRTKSIREGEEKWTS